MELQSTQETTGFDTTAALVFIQQLREDAETIGAPTEHYNQPLERLQLTICTIHVPPAPQAPKQSLPNAWGKVLKRQWSGGYQVAESAPQPQTNDVAFPKLSSIPANISQNPWFKVADKKKRNAMFGHNAWTVVATSVVAVSTGKPVLTKAASRRRSSVLVLTTC